MSEPNYLKCPQCGGMGIPVDADGISLTSDLKSAGPMKGTCILCGYELDTERDILLEAFRFLFQNKPEEALQKLGGLTHESQQTASAIWARGLALASLGRHDEASDCLQPLVPDLDADNSDLDLSEAIVGLQAAYICALSDAKAKQFSRSLEKLALIDKFITGNGELFVEKCLQDATFQTQWAFFRFLCRSLRFQIQVSTEEYQDAEKTLRLLEEEFFPNGKIRFLPGSNLSFDAGTFVLWLLIYLWVVEDRCSPALGANTVDVKSQYSKFFTSLGSFAWCFNQDRARLLKRWKEIIESAKPFVTNEYRNPIFYWASIRWQLESDLLEMLRTRPHPEAFDAIEADLRRRAIDWNGPSLAPDRDIDDMVPWIVSETCDKDENEMIAEGVFGAYLDPLSLYAGLLDQSYLPPSMKTELEDRIILLSDNFEKAPVFEKGFVRRAGFEFPQIVGQLYERRCRFDDAIAHYTRTEDIDRCKFRRDGFLDERLRAKLREVPREYQVQAYAYLHVFELEVKLRELMREVLSKAYGKESWWRKCIPKSFRDSVHELMLAQMNNPYFRCAQGTPEPIEFLTLTQLIHVIVQDEANWKLFEPCFYSKAIFRGIMESLDWIRNDIAHARFLTQQALDKLINGVTEILRAIEEYRRRQA